MDPIAIVPLWVIFAVLPGLLLWRHVDRAKEPSFPWVFLTFLLGPLGLAGWLLSRAADRLVVRATGR